MYQRERSTSSLKLVSYSDFESYDIFVSLSRLWGFVLHNGKSGLRFTCFSLVVNAWSSCPIGLL